MADETFRHTRYATSLSRIKLVRMHRGLRQVDVARRIEVSESYLSKIETGRVTPSDVLLDKIAEALDVDASDLVGQIEFRQAGRSA